MRVLNGFAVLAIGLSVAVSAGAAPLTVPATDHNIATVAEGCGPGGFRGEGGRCFFRRPPPPRFRRPCPPGMHPTPYGCRRNF